VEEGRLFSGRWYEIAHTRQKAARDCVGGVADFSLVNDGEVREMTSCHLGSPSGKVRVGDASVAFINPGLNNKILVRYRVMGAFYVPKTYWILDHGVEYGWFMLWDPRARTLVIYTRTSSPSPRQRDILLSKAQALGYGADRLEFDAPVSGAPAERPAS
jgi:apolipoprotein D and lipocalin family protein